jgi:hypothetical protein
LRASVPKTVIEFKEKETNLSHTNPKEKKTSAQKSKEEKDFAISVK